VGEVGQAHDGSLGMAHAFIDAIATAGADAVKFQTHLADAESTPAEPWRTRFSKQDETRYDYWKRMQFSEPQWAGLRRHAHERGLRFLSSPFSLEAVELLERVGIDAWKLASGEVGNLPLVRRLVEGRTPVVVSSGFSPVSELDDCVAVLREAGVETTVLQCTTEYPCPPERVGLNLIDEFRERYGCFVGLSDHSGTIFAGLAAVAQGRGIDLLEVHVTLSREMFGPDVVASITTAELRQLVDGVRFIEAMRANPVDKNDMAETLEPLRAIFAKSLVARTTLQAGTVLRDTDLRVKKPGTGIPARRLDEVVGRRLRRHLEADELLRDADLEPVR
jgi:N-acetylneuraminate synthase